MKEKDKRTINIVIHYCNRMEDYSNRFNNDKEIYLSDKLYQDACALVIIQIGEFVGRLSDEFRDNHQEINWQEIIGMRNIFAHNYEDVIDDIVWDVILSGKGHLPRYYKRKCKTVLLQQFPMTVESPCFSCGEYVKKEGECHRVVVR